MYWKKYELHFYIFLLFQSNRTPEECANWCDETANCYGFAVVREGYEPGKNRCWLKHKLTCSTDPLMGGVLVYYRLHGEFAIKEYLFEMDGWKCTNN